jgi:hypothetical protein
MFSNSYYEPLCRELSLDCFRTTTCWQSERIRINFLVTSPQLVAQALVMMEMITGRLAKVKQENNLWKLKIETSPMLLDLLILYGGPLLELPIYAGTKGNVKFDKPLIDSLITACFS